jgi:hypothetical protein
MAKLGKWGALAGLGVGVTQHGEMKRQEWFQAAQEQSRLAAEERSNEREDAKEKTRTADLNTREERQIAREAGAETRAATREKERYDQETGRRVSETTASNTEWGRREGISQKNRLEELNTRASLDQAPSATGKIQKVGADLIKTLPDGSMQIMKNPEYGADPVWQNIGAAGTGGAPPELQLKAKEYAGGVADDMDTFGIGSDATDFAKYGGSKTRARDAFVQEFLQKRGYPSNSSAQPAPVNGQPANANQQAGAPVAGTVIDGFKFLGGNPKDPSRWQQVQ